MQSREKSVLTLIYPRRPSESLVLLGLKKRGFGEGKFNGFGGKLESGETLEESAVRELKEECGLVSKLADLKWRGCLTYIYNTKPKAMEVNVFDLQNWEGDPIETEEMKPRWFEHQAVPLSSMWADDEFWLLQYLEGGLQTPFIGRFRFKNHEGPESWDILEHNIASLVPASVPRDIGGSESGAAMVASTVSFLNAPSARPLESFIRYHLSKGFARILIFIDSAEDLAALDVVRRFPALRVLHKIRGPDLLKEQSVKSPDTFGAMSNFFNEVSARQLLDAELALQMAPELGCRWLLYLDSDELFYTKEASVVPHFQYLERSGIQQMSYLNHEGVPEKAETEDYFATVTLFKQHHFAVPLSAQARSALRFWMDRSKRGQYFLFYDNGKSACRTDCHANPKNQHIWQLPPGSTSCTALADPRHMDVDGFVDCPDPCILHFPVCGLSWLTGKYRTLGRFPDKWLGKVNLSESFHKDARDLAESCSALEDLFMQEVLLEDKSEVGRQLEARTCMRILDHAELLDAEARASAVETESEKTILPLADASLIGIEKGWILS